MNIRLPSLIKKHGRFLQWQSLFACLIICTICMPRWTWAMLPAGTKIENIATASFESAGASLVITANHSIVVNQQTPSHITLSRMVGSATPNAEGGVLFPTQCLTAPETWRPLSEAQFSGQRFAAYNDIHFIATKTLLSETPLLIALTDLDKNQNPTVIEHIQVVVTASQSGDQETLQLTETDVSSGVFAGYIQTTRGAAIRSNCVLETSIHDSLNVHYVDASDTEDVSHAAVTVDPLSRVFDSQTGVSIANAVVEIYDNVTNQRLDLPDSNDPTKRVPARYITSALGEFSVPMLLPGQYRFVVTPPKEYHFPSIVPISELQQVSNPAVLGEATYGKVFTIFSNDDMFLVDIALDKSKGRLEVEKFTTASMVSHGDMVNYHIKVHNAEQFPLAGISVFDRLPQGLFLVKPEATLVVNDAETGVDARTAVPIKVDATGKQLEVVVGQLLANQTVQLYYNVLVSATTPIGQAVNTAYAAGDGKTSNTAHATIMVKDELLSTQSILLGRVIDRCNVRTELSNDGSVKGVAGVRIQLEDGRYNISDSNGRWHIENVKPGTHVVQADRQSIPKGYRLVRCDTSIPVWDKQDKRSKKIEAQMVDLKPGTLWQVDFALEKIVNAQTESAANTEEKENVAIETTTSGTIASGFDEGWIEQQPIENRIVFPTAEFIPVTSAVGFAVQYKTYFTAQVFMNEQAVSPLMYDGSITNQAGTLNVATWRAIPLQEGKNTIKVVLRQNNGDEQVLLRDVYYSSTPEHVYVQKEQSQLMADGKTPIVVAVRLTDAFDHPLRKGMTGHFSIEGQYIAADWADPSKRDPLSRAANSALKYTVGENGIAKIVLQPSAVSGPLTLNMHMANNRVDVLKVWIDVAQREWMLVGLAEKTYYGGDFKQKMAPLEGAPGVERSDPNGRVSFYAVGTVRGDTLLTLAYDSDKVKTDAQTNLAQVLRSDEHYLVYADSSVASHAALSSSKLYIRVDRKAFSAVYGDYHTNLGGGKLNGYHRALTGIRTDYHGQAFAVSAFIAQTGTGVKHDEIAVDGTSGTYHLSAQQIKPGSEKIVLELRSQDLAQHTAQSRTLTPFVDYTIDYSTGDVWLTALPMGQAGYRLVLVADYETILSAQSRESLVSGARIARTFKLTDSPLQSSEIGLNVINDNSASATSGVLIGADASLHLTERTLLKTEVARSKKTSPDALLQEQPSAIAWSVEALHQDKQLGMRAYASQTEAQFGLGQVSVSSGGVKQLGVDANYKLKEQLSVVASFAQTQRDASSTVSQADTQTQTASLLLNANLPLNKTLEKEYVSRVEVGGKYAAQDSGISAQSANYATMGLRFGRKDGAWNTAFTTQKALADKRISSAPERTMLSADYKLKSNVVLNAAQEQLAYGNQRAMLSRIGLRYSPATGRAIFGDIGQGVDANGDTVPMQHYGFDYRYPINSRWYVDGGYVRQMWQGTDRLLSSDIKASYLPTAYLDDYNSYKLGLNYQYNDWTMQSKLERREGTDFDRDQLGVVVYHRLNDGIALSGGVLVVNTHDVMNNTKTDQSVNLAWSNRHQDTLFTPKDDAQWVWLHRVEYVNQQNNGQSTDDSQSRKLRSNLHVNGKWHNQHELSMHYGLKQVWQSNTYGEFNGITQFLSSEYRRSLTPIWDIGANTFGAFSQDVYSLGYGVSIGVHITPQAWISLGYNDVGLRSGLYNEADHSAQGWYLRFRMYFDQELFHLGNVNEF